MSIEQYVNVLACYSMWYMPIEKAGAHLLYCRHTARIFVPLKMMWPKLKCSLRKWESRSVDALLAALSEAVALISVNDIFGWFTQSGYSYS